MKKNHLTKLALAGLLVAANLPSGVQADVMDSNVSYLAVAGCQAHGGCGGQKPTPTTTNSGSDAQNGMKPNPNKNVNNNGNSTVGNPANHS